MSSGEPVPTSTFPTPARRGLNCVLDAGRLKSVYGLALRPWREALEDAIATQHLEGMERLRQREAQDIQVMEGAVARLAGVLRPGAPLADSEGLTEKQRQLLGACNRVLAASGYGRLRRRR